MSKFLKRHFLLLFVVGFIQTNADPSHAAEPIRIGFGAPFSGPAAEFGEAVKSGVVFATQQINARGGIHGRPIEVFYEDDACDPKQAIVVASRLVQKKVIAATHICDVTSEAAKPVYIENNVLFAPITKRSAITEKGGGLVVQMMASHEDYGRVVAKELFPKHAKNKIAILATNDLYGQGLLESLGKIFKSNGRTFDYQEIFSDPTVKDYSATITKLKNEKVNVVILSLWNNMIADFMRQAAQQGLDAFFISTDSGGDILVPLVAGKAAEKLVFVSVDFVDRLASNPKLKAEMQAAHFDPKPHAQYGYFAVQALAAAIEKSTDLSAKNLMTSFKTNTLTTFAGDITFDTEGHLHGLTSKLYTWKDGLAVPY